MTLPMSPGTLSCSPAPIMLLTRVLHVDENAISTTHISPETFLTMLDTASERSPRCSTKRKNMNHVDTERKFSIIVHTDMLNMTLSSFHSNFAGLCSPNLRVSVLVAVYTRKNISETSSARVEPMAAPAIPRAGNPSFPYMSIQLKTTFDSTITMELRVSVFVCMVPM